jgi:hypothetical protein
MVWAGNSDADVASRADETNYGVAASGAGGTTITRGYDDTAISAAEAQAQAALEYLVPSTHGDMTTDAISRLYASGDDASRWGTQPGTRPMESPFTFEQIVKTNASHLRLCPWLQVRHKVQ